MRENLDLSIIIVNYNTFKLTKETIDSCLAEPTHYTYEIFLVDNKSTDDSLEKLEEYFKDEISRGIIKVIANSANKGFANANNLAIEKAKGEYILLLNSDTLIKEGTIDKCMDYITKATNADIGALGCKVSLADGSLDKACKRSFPNPVNAFASFLLLCLYLPKSVCSNLSDCLRKANHFFFWCYCFFQTFCV